MEMFLVGPRETRELSYGSERLGNIFASPGDSLLREGNKLK